jgi:hypothetical protein
MPGRTALRNRSWTTPGTDGNATLWLSPLVLLY